MANRLRELGYSSDDGRVITCHKTGAFDDRWLHERVGVIRIDTLERNSKPMLGLIERLIIAADEPRALRGTGRNGSVVLLLKVGEHSDLPLSEGDGEFKLVTRDDEPLKITCASLGHTIPVDEYSWVKGRSPFDVEHSRLPVLFKDVGDRIVNEAFKHGCADAPSAAQRETAERVATINRGLQDGSITPLEPRERRHEEDLAFLRKHSDIGPFDALKPMVDAVRLRVFNWSQERKRAAAGG
jgi:hypothetical protein